MKTKIIIKTIMVILLSILLLFSLTGFTNAEGIEEIPNYDVDTSYNEILESINKTLEKTEETERINSRIKNLKFDSYSYKLHVFCKENNDKQIDNAHDIRVNQISNGNYNVFKYI